MGQGLSSQMLTSWIAGLGLIYTPKYAHIILHRVTKVTQLHQLSVGMHVQIATVVQN